MKERFKNNPIKNMVWTEERRKKVGLKIKGRKVIKETKLKMSKAQYGINNGMYGLYGKDNPNFGKNLTEGHREKISRTLKNYWDQNEQRKKEISGENSITKRPEVREKMSKNRKGKSLSTEHKEKIAKTLKGRKGVNFGRHFSEESKKKNSEAQKLRFKKMTKEQKK